MTKYLSTLPDGVGFHYGFRPDDKRRIDARQEGDVWICYVAGEKAGTASDLEMAELCALTWMDQNPDPDADDDEYVAKTFDREDAMDDCLNDHPFYVGPDRSAGDY